MLSTLRLLSSATGSTTTTSHALINGKQQAMMTFVLSKSAALHFMASNNNNNRQQSKKIYQINQQLLKHPKQHYQQTTTRLFSSFSLFSINQQSQQQQQQQQQNPSVSDIDSASAKGFPGGIKEAQETLSFIPPPPPTTTTTSATASATTATSAATAATNNVPESVHFRLGEKQYQETIKTTDDNYLLPHRIWSKDEVQQVEITHHKPQNFVDWSALVAIKSVKFVFDLFSGFMFGARDENKWLTRIIFLETVAAVPGMVAAMTRHLHSLRRMQRDYGWIHTLLEEAENERMHLLTALELKRPSLLFRAAVLGTQGIFVTWFSIFYLIAPRFCHRFVGYLEEEAVGTYTKCLADLDTGALPMWSKLAAPPIAVKYWNLAPDAMMKDVILAIRADEGHHRLVNHTFANIHAHNGPNPYAPGE